VTRCGVFVFFGVHVGRRLLFYVAYSRTAMMTVSIHSVSVMRIAFFFGAQYFSDWRRRHEARIQTARTIVAMPSIPWSSRVM